MPEFLVSLCIAFGFARLGELTLSRSSHSLFAWNQSFLVGAAVASTLLFPLSLILPGHALLAVAGLVLGAAAFRLPSRMTSFSFAQLVRSARESAVFRDLPSLVLLVLISVLVMQFVLQNSRLSYLWDGYQIWATKALVLYERGGLSKDLLTPGEPDRLAEYPPMVPLYGALVSTIRGEFEWNSLKPIFVFFYLSMLISTCHAARQLVSTRLALAATALVALLPAMSTRANVGGYADMPQAAFVAGVLAALLSSSKVAAGPLSSASAWILAGLVLVKNEGIILLTVACTMVGVMWLSEGRGNLKGIFLRQRNSVTIVLACIMLRRLYVLWVDAHDLTYGPLDMAHIERAFSLLTTVPALCLRPMLDFSEWGLFWPAFLVAVPVLLLAGSRVQRLLVLGILLALAAYTSVFLFTNWDVQLHIDQAYSRLLTHLAPAAAIVIVAAYSRLRGRP